jgi:cytochrome c peroxidase
MTITVRNTPLMADLSPPGGRPRLFHFDGEFSTPEDLVIDTLTGRNFGWLPTERDIARTHIAKIIREDNGFSPRYIQDRLGKGISYSTILRGTAPEIPADLRISTEFRLDTSSASDDAIIEVVAKLIHAYMDSLRFGTDHTFRSSESPYDVFLKKNGLPGAPIENEKPQAYAKRLLWSLNARSHFVWVSDQDSSFKLHDQKFAFGAIELRGLKTFLSRTGKNHSGNCVGCHPPPRFTDFAFHNNGASQDEYDSIFGHRAFNDLHVPDLVERNLHYDEYLPSTPKHPLASGRFRAVPSPTLRGYADLGAWNVLGNPDMPKPQELLLQTLCDEAENINRLCTAEAILPFTVAYFKTPTVRDLGQSGPYFHTGTASTIEEALDLYVRNAALSRSGELRNPSPELTAIHIERSDIRPLAAFLRSLNEDYH